jgi:hypothetical protein
MDNITNKVREENRSPDMKTLTGLGGRRKGI